ncbi:tigger transposable element-derived protein 1 [Trichonephila clavipes]|nr:tigger transposable element-derived protein 1 [Trichonephila clavipes]
MPNRTYITKDEKGIPGHKPMKYRLTLILGANTSGDMKLKPLLVYHSENLRAFKKYSIIKSKLPVMWRSNQRACVTQDLFKEWLFKVCAPSIKDYLKTNDLPLKALLLLDNAPGHPKDLTDNLLTYFPWLTVQFLPPNTTSLIQPMEQEAWSEVPQRQLISAWRKQCPSFVQGDGGDQGDTPEIMDEILTTARDLELEVNEDDIVELIIGYEHELTTEELQEILNEEHQETQRNMSPSEQEEDERGPMSTSAIKDLLKKGEVVRAMVLEWHPNQTDVSRVGDLYNDKTINYFRKILKKREKQSTMDMFFNAP